MAMLITDESSEYNQLAEHRHVDAGRCLRCNAEKAYEPVEALPFVSKTREAMKDDVLRLDRDRIDLSKQLREARDLVRQTQEDMSELCVSYARTAIDLTNAEFRIKHLKTLVAGGVAVTAKDLDGIFNKSDADAVPEYQKAA